MDTFLSAIAEMFSSPEFQTALANILIITITGVAAAISKAIFSFVKTNTNERQFLLLQSLAVAAVRAAEQGELAGYVSDKKASAFNVIDAYLKQMGITGITAAQIDAAIEAAVLTQFNAYKTQPVPQFPFPFPVDPDEPTPETEPVPEPEPEEANGN